MTGVIKFKLVSWKQWQIGRENCDNSNLTYSDPKGLGPWYQQPDNSSATPAVWPRKRNDQIINIKEFTKIFLQIVLASYSTFCICKVSASFMVLAHDILSVCVKLLTWITMLTWRFPQTSGRKVPRNINCCKFQDFSSSNVHYINPLNASIGQFYLRIERT